MNQPTLFDTDGPVNQYGDPIEARQLARSTDPETSKEAADHATGQLNANQLRFLIALTSLVRATASEVARRAWPDIEGENNHARRETIRKRAYELVNSGQIETAGARKCDVSGRRAMTYRVAKQVATTQVARQ